MKVESWNIEDVPSPKKAAPACQDARSDTIGTQTESRGVYYTPPAVEAAMSAAYGFNRDITLDDIVKARLEATT